MRKIDKKSNLAKVSLLNEQKYLESKGFINENGPITDINGVTDTLVRHYKNGVASGKNLGMIDAQVYDLIKKTLNVHGASPETKKAMYLMMGDKLKQTGDSRLMSFGQSYNSIGQSLGSENPMGDATDLINHVKDNGGLK